MNRNILFLCTGNSARSQMAAALLKKHAGSIFKTFSAGTEPREKIFEPVVRVMQEICIDLSEEKPKGLKTFLGRKHFEYVIIVCGEADKQCPAIFGQSRRLFWPFDDPAQATGSEEEILSFCRKVRDQIDNEIAKWLKEDALI